MRKNIPPVFTIALVLIMLSGMMSGSISSFRADMDLPDLVIEELSAEPLEAGGYTIHLTVSNEGTSSSDECVILLLDEYDLIHGNTSTIGRLTLPSLDEGGSYSLETEWDPLPTDLHRLWAIVDPSSTGEESTGENNVATMFLQLPRVIEVGSELDMTPNREELGTYLAGIPLEVPVHTRFDIGGDPRHYRVYYQDDNNSAVFVPYVGGGDFETRIDIGGLPPGSNRMTVNSSFARIPLDPYHFLMDVREVPGWISGLDMREVHFDTDLKCYNSTGYIDIPTLSGSFNVEGTRGISDVTAFQGNRDLMLRVWTKLDGASTIDVLGSFDLKIGGTSFHLSFKNRSYVDDPWGNNSISVTYRSALCNVSLFPRGEDIIGEVFDGRSVPITVSPILCGEASLELVLEMDASGGPLRVKGGLSLTMAGDTDSLVAEDIPGFDRPVVQAVTSSAWSSSHTLGEGGEWSTSGSASCGISMMVRDTGLILSGGQGSWELPDGETGSDLALTPEGEVAYVRITKGAGHSNVLAATVNGTEYQVYSDNRYISSPGMVFLGDSTPVASWTRALNWSNETASRVSSLRTMVSVGEEGGGFNGNISELDSMDVMELHPHLASDGKRMAAVVWTMDPDSDPTTLTDQEVMVSILRDGSWSPPEKVTDNSLWDDLPKAAFDGASNLWVAWMSEGGRGVVAFRDNVTEQWSVPMTLDGTGLSSGISSLELSSSDDGTPVLAFVSRDSSEEAPWKISGMILENERMEYDERITIAEFEEPVGDMSLTRGLDGRLALVWRTFGDGDGELWSSILSLTNNTLSFTDPLALTNDSRAEFHPRMLPLAGGEMLFSRVRASANPGEEPPAELLDILDLSNGGRILEVDNELLGDYNRWETVKIGATVKNIGLSPRGRIYVNLDRISRDPFTGNISEVSIGSRLVTFSSPEEEMRVEFTTTMVENQLRYRIWTASGWGDPPAVLSSADLPMPIVGDPRILGVRVVEGGERSFQRSFDITMGNRGLISVDPLRIDILHEAGPASWMGGVTLDEPFGIREPADADVVNGTSIGIGPGMERSIVLNASADPGRNVFWVRLTEPDGGTLFHGPIMVDLFRSYAISAEPDHGTMIEGSEGSLEITLVDTSALPSCDVDCGPLNGTMIIEILDNLGRSVMNSSVNVTLPDNGTSRKMRIELPTSHLDPGTYGISLTLVWVSGISPGAVKGVECGSKLSVIPASSLIMTGIDTQDQGFSGKIFRVRVRNDSNRTVPLARLVLFNGPLTDNVLLSEGMALAIGPGEEVEMDLEFSLEEGVYFLSLGLFSDRPDAASLPWDPQLRDEISFEYRENATLSDTGEKDKVNMDDVKDSALIGGSAILSVLLVAALFKRKEEKSE